MSVSFSAILEHSFLFPFPIAARGFFLNGQPITQNSNKLLPINKIATNQNELGDSAPHREDSEPCRIRDLVPVQNTRLFRATSSAHSSEIRDVPARSSLQNPTPLPPNSRGHGLERHCYRRPRLAPHLTTVNAAIYCSYEIQIFVLSYYEYDQSRYGGRHHDSDARAPRRAAHPSR